MKGLALMAALFPIPALADSLTIGTAGHYPPFLVLQDGQRSGLDPDLLDDFCRAGGHDCTWVDMPLETALAALVDRRIDILAGGIGINADREKVIDFTCPYYAIDGATGEFRALTEDTDPAAQPVAVSRGSIYERAAVKAGLAVRGYDGEVEAAQAMLSGEVAVFFGAPQVIDDLARGVETQFLGSLPTETSGPAFAVSEEAPDLLAALNDFLADRSARGRLSALQVQWLGLDQGDVIATCITDNALS